MKSKILYLIIIIFCSSVSYGQINIKLDAAVANLLRYGNGYQYTGSVKNPKGIF